MGGAFSFAQGGRGPGGPGRGPLLFALGRMCASWAGAGRAGGLFLPWAALLFLLRSCARVAEDGVCCLL